jgi:hypothetical protein
LKGHWDSFVSINDFRKIASSGFNVVRIPVGYWSYLDLGGPYIMGAAPYVDKAVQWARETGLKVIIDLHGKHLGGQNRASESMNDAEILYRCTRISERLRSLRPATVFPRMGPRRYHQSNIASLTDARREIRQEGDAKCSYRDPDPQRTLPVSVSSPPFTIYLSRH